MSIDGWTLTPRFFVSQVRFAFWPSLELISLGTHRVHSLSLQFGPFVLELFALKGD